MMMAKVKIRFRKIMQVISLTALDRIKINMHTIKMITQKNLKNK